MSKTVKVTAILGLLMYFGYILLGKGIVPAVMAMLSRQKRYISGPAVGMYVGIQFIGFLPVIVFLIYSILALVASNSEKTGIGMEVSGLILIDAIHPILAGIVSLILTLTVYRVGTLVMKPNEAYYGYTLLNQFSAYLNPMGLMARTLLTISLVVSACRKKTLEPISYED